MEENRSTSEHVPRLSKYYNRLNQVGVNLPDKIVIDRVLQSLSPSCQNFMMNYARDDKNDSRALRDVEIDEGRNQERASNVDAYQDHQFQEKGKGKKWNFKKNDKQVVTLVKKPKAGPKPETECFYCKGNGHWKRNCPKCLADKNDGKVNKGTFDIHVIDVYFTSVYSNPSVFDTSSVLRVVTRNGSCKINRDQLRAR